LALRNPRDEEARWGIGCLVVVFSPGLIGVLCYFWIVPFFFWGWNIARSVDTTFHINSVPLPHLPTDTAAGATRATGAGPSNSITPAGAPAPPANAAAPVPAAEKTRRSEPDNGD